MISPGYYCGTKRNKDNTNLIENFAEQTRCITGGARMANTKNLPYSKNGGVLRVNKGPFHQWKIIYLEDTLEDLDVSIRRVIDWR